MGLDYSPCGLDAPWLMDLHDGMAAVLKIGQNTIGLLFKNPIWFGAQVLVLVRGLGGLILGPLSRTRVNKDD